MHLHLYWQYYSNTVVGVSVTFFVYKNLSLSDYTEIYISWRGNVNWGISYNAPTHQLAGFKG